mmetsp:Transcript_65354/g.200080  ORF Transcript_65354/g.200080 Transcript_65354/m.200080 type:complete len:609 (+) Transcript_65354:312-2138(+)
MAVAAEGVCGVRCEEPEQNILAAPCEDGRRDPGEGEGVPRLPGPHHRRDAQGALLRGGDQRGEGWRGRGGLQARGQEAGPAHAVQQGRPALLRHQQRRRPWRQPAPADDLPGLLRRHDEPRARGPAADPRHDVPDPAQGDNPGDDGHRPGDPQALRRRWGGPVGVDIPLRRGHGHDDVQQQAVSDQGGALRHGPVGHLHVLRSRGEEDAANQFRGLLQPELPADHREGPAAARGLPGKGVRKRVPDPRVLRADWLQRGDEEGQDHVQRGHEAGEGQPPGAAHRDRQPGRPHDDQRARRDGPAPAGVAALPGYGASGGGGAHVRADGSFVWRGRHEEVHGRRRQFPEVDERRLAVPHAHRGLAPDLPRVGRRRPRHLAPIHAGHRAGGVQHEVGRAEADHLHGPEERARAGVARQDHPRDPARPFVDATEGLDAGVPVVQDRHVHHVSVRDAGREERDDQETPLHRYDLEPDRAADQREILRALVACGVAMRADEASPRVSDHGHRRRRLRVQGRRGLHGLRRVVGHAMLGVLLHGLLARAGRRGALDVRAPAGGAEGCPAALQGQERRLVAGAFHRLQGLVERTGLGDCGRDGDCRNEEVVGGHRLHQ